MTTETNDHAAIVRTDRGLSIRGTRITLYSIMDYLRSGWPPKLIRDRLGLTASQVEAAQRYIDEHGPEVETEYQTVVCDAEQNRQYWDERLRDREAAIAARPAKPEEAVVRAKLAATKARLDGR